MVQRGDATTERCRQMAYGRAMDAALAQRLAELEARLGALSEEIKSLRASADASSVPSAKPTAASAKPTAFEHNRRMQLSLTEASSFGVRCPSCAHDGRSVEMTPLPGNRQMTIDCGNYLLVDALCASCGTVLKLWRKKA